jgi:hypothetical protein
MTKYGGNFSPRAYENNGYVSFLKENTVSPFVPIEVRIFPMPPSEEEPSTIFLYPRQGIAHLQPHTWMGILSSPTLFTILPMFERNSLPFHHPQGRDTPPQQGIAELPLYLFTTTTWVSHTLESSPSNLEPSQPKIG